MNKNLFLLIIGLILSLCAKSQSLLNEIDRLESERKNRDLLEEKNIDNELKLRPSVEAYLKKYQFLLNRSNKEKDSSSYNLALKKEAFEVLKKMYVLHAKQPSALLNNREIFELYFAFSSIARNSYYNANYNKALSGYLEAEKVYEYIYKKAFTYKEIKVAAIDTATVSNIAIITRLFTRDTTLAVLYYEKLLSLHLFGEKHIEYQQFLLTHYFNKKDFKKFDALEELYVKNYINDLFAFELKLKNLKTTLEHLQLYKGNATKYAQSFQFNSNYVLLLYNYIYQEGNNRTKQLVDELSTLLNKTLAMQSTIILLALNANFLYNELDINVKELNALTSKAELKKQKSEEIKNIQNSILNTVEKSITIYEGKTKNSDEDKNYYKHILDIGKAIATFKNDKQTADKYLSKLKLL